MVLQATAPKAATTDRGGSKLPRTQPCDRGDTPVGSSDLRLPRSLSGRTGGSARRPQSVDGKIDLVLRGYDRDRLFFRHDLVLPLHHVYNFFPYLGFGLTSVEISKIECQHPSQEDRGAVQTAHPPLDRYHRLHDR